jgi:CDP-diacylglycerol--serine O-phosphatidyltransferase
VQLGAEHPTLLRLGGMASFFFVACGACGWPVSM